MVTLRKNNVEPTKEYIIRQGKMIVRKVADQTYLVPWTEVNNELWGAVSFPTYIQVFENIIDSINDSFK